MLKLPEKYQEIFKTTCYGAFAEYEPPLSFSIEKPETQIFAYVPSWEVYLTMRYDNPPITTSLEIHDMDFPLIRLFITITNEPTMPDSPLAIEVFFNVLDPRDVTAFKSLFQQKSICVHLIEDDFTVFTLKIPWHSQKEAMDIWSKAESMLENKTVDDFFRARETFITNILFPGQYKN